MFIRSRRTAFTLIELLVTTGIIVLMLSITMPAFLNFQKEQNLQLAAQGVRDSILEAQNYALAPRSGEGNNGKPAGANFYRFVIDTGALTYSVQEQSLTTGITAPRDYLSATWGSILKSTRFVKGVELCSGSTDSRLIDDPRFTSNGIVYSITDSGKIVGPDTKGTFRIVIKQLGVADHKSIEVQGETGRVEIKDTTDC